MTLICERKLCWQYVFYLNNSKDLDWCTIATWSSVFNLVFLITSVLTSKSNCKKCRLMQRCQYLSDCKCMELDESALHSSCILIGQLIMNWKTVKKCQHYLKTWLSDHVKAIKCSNSVKYPREVNIYSWYQQRSLLTSIYR